MGCDIAILLYLYIRSLLIVITTIGLLAFICYWLEKIIKDRY